MKDLIKAFKDVRLMLKELSGFKDVRLMLKELSGFNVRLLGTALRLTGFTAVRF